MEGIMAKTNYSKAEEFFDDGMRKMMVNKLHETVDATQGKESPNASVAERKRLLLILHHELQYFQKKGFEPYKKMNIDKKKLAGWLEHPETVTDVEWKLIQGYHANIVKVKKPPEDKAEAINEAFAEAQRKKSPYKRFNLNDNWLPLQ